MAPVISSSLRLGYCLERNEEVSCMRRGKRPGAVDVLDGPADSAGRKGGFDVVEALTDAIGNRPVIRAAMAQRGYYECCNCHIFLL